MPHEHPYVRADAKTVLLDLFGDWEGVEAALAELVAEGFLTHTGEVLKIGEEILVHATVDTTSMPANFAVIVVAWWTSKRAPYFEDIWHDIESILRSWDSSLNRAEIHLNVIGDPARKGAEPFDPAGA